jgi:hypothetical protein
MQLLKERTLTKLFVEQDNNHIVFILLIQETTFEKSNMEVKKKKSAKHITKLKKKMHCNYCYENEQWVKIL